MEGCSGRTRRGSAALSLKQRCLLVVRTHFTALGAAAVLDLPTPLLQELLPHLNVVQLDALQPALNQRGLSTHSSWAGILREVVGPSRALDFRTEEAAKQEVMLKLFTSLFYGLRNSYLLKNSSQLEPSSLLAAAARSVPHFILYVSMHKALQALIADQQPLLALLESHISCVHLSHLLQERIPPGTLHVLHRLLDHGVTTHLVVNFNSPLDLAWLLRGRRSWQGNPELRRPASCIRCVQPTYSAGKGGGSRASGDLDDGPPPCKRARPSSGSVEPVGEQYGVQDPQLLCPTLSPGAPSAAGAPFGQITQLEIRTCGPDSLQVLVSCLPTFFCLRSLTLHSMSIFEEAEVLELAAAVRRLSNSSHSSLSHLDVSLLPHPGLLRSLLDAAPTLTSLCVEIQTGIWGPQVHPDKDASDCPLEKLTVKVTTQLPTQPLFLTSVLRRCPRLSSLHVAGLRLPAGSSQSQLLATLSESCPCLKTLTLEDLKLCDCLPDILQLLRGYKLEELHLSDCRLLEKSSDPEWSLRQLVVALRTAPLRSLGLAQNRLAGNVSVLAELFSGPSQSPLTHLDIRSNFIQPADLLALAERLSVHPPTHRLTFDLRRNPGDRAPEAWSAALKRLRSFGVLLVEGWTSTGAMVDHISNM